MPNAEILATGDEIRSGAVRDENTPWLAGQLELAGLAVTRHTCVGDDSEAISRVLDEIARRCDTAVITGGLGPTADDVTAEAAARAAGTQLELDETALANVQRALAGFGRSGAGRNRKQALLPRGAVCLENEIGTAPGFRMRLHGCLLFFLPGVPGEMKRMFEDRVLAALRDELGPGLASVCVKTVSTFGLYESEVAQRLDDLEEIFPGLRLGLRFVFPEIRVTLSARSETPEEAQALLARATRCARDRLGDCAFSEDGLSMPAVVGEMLRERGATLALAESCTGGLIAHMITGVSGSSDYFLLSAVTYANRLKTAMLGVSPETVRSFGAVSEETAREMAGGVRSAAGADYALSTSGIAGPSGGTESKPVGTVCLGLASPDGVRARRLCFPFTSRRANKRIFAVSALDMLRRELMQPLTREP
jgi:nicotinamide-nucleotide amidase